MATFFIYMLLAAGAANPVGQWMPGRTETSTYKLAEAGLPGTSKYTMRSILRDSRPVLEVEVITHRTLVLGGQRGLLETICQTRVDPGSFDLVESRLVTTLNGSESSYLHAERVGNKIEVRQKLRGSPLEIRIVEAGEPVIEESAMLPYLERLPWTQGREFRWLRFSPAQTRVLHVTARMVKDDGKILRITMETEIGPSAYEIRHGSPGVVVRTEAGGSEQMVLVP